MFYVPLNAPECFLLWCRRCRCQCIIIFVQVNSSGHDLFEMTCTRADHVRVTMFCCTVLEHLLWTFVTFSMLIQSSELLFSWLSTACFIGDKLISQMETTNLPETITPTPIQAWISSSGHAVSSPDIPACYCCRCVVPDLISDPDTCFWGMGDTGYRRDMETASTFSQISCFYSMGKKTPLAPWGKCTHSFLGKIFKQVTGVKLLNTL